MADVFCARCGHRNPIGSNFCSSCGASLTDIEEHHTTTLAFTPEAESTAVDDEVALDVPSPAGVGMLVVKRGPNVGSRFALEGTVTRVGRHPNSDIFLDDITVSRRHVEVVSSADGFTVRDVGSLNGTYVNRQRIEEAELNDGDELQIGTFKLVFVAGSAS